jgi:putative DNA primase/helicase
MIGQAMLTVARLTPSHPVRNYLNGLRWDGQHRIDSWLTRYMGVAQSHYSNAVGSKWLISAVARVMRPGSKVDTALVLEGKQGIGKSRALRILGGDWFTDNLGDLREKDTLLQLAGKWIVELGELDAISRHESTQVKAFLSRQEDVYRVPFGRVSESFPRQCVFAGTTNSDTHLKDETGNRRWWPVRCQKIDLAALAQDRDQLWAEAFAMFKEGKNWYLDSELLTAEH